MPTTVPTPTVSPARPPAEQLGQHLTHVRSPPSAPRSVARECPATKSSTYGSAATHPALHRLVAGLAAVRVHPDHAVREPAQPRHLLAEQRRVAALPAVAEDHDDRAAGHPALAPAVEEGLAAPRPAGCRRTSRGRVRPAAASARSGSRRRSARVTRVSRVPSVNTSVDAGAAPHHDVGEAQQRVGVGSSSRTRRPAARPRGRRDRSRRRQHARLAVGAQRRAQGAPGVGGAAPGGGRRRRDGRVGGRGAAARTGPRRCVALGQRQLGDVAVAQHLGAPRRWPAPADRRRRPCRPPSGFPRGQQRRQARGPRALRRGAAAGAGRRRTRRRRPGRSAPGRRGRRTAWPAGAVDAARRPTPRASTAVRNAVTRSVVTGTPAARSTAANPTSSDGSGCAPVVGGSRSSGTGHDGEQPVEPARTRSASSRYFTTAPSVRRRAVEVELGGRRGAAARAPSRASRRRPAA